MLWTACRRSSGRPCVGMTTETLGQSSTETAGCCPAVGTVFGEAVVIGAFDVTGNGAPMLPPGPDRPPRQFALFPVLRGRSGPLPGCREPVTEGAWTPILAEAPASSGAGFCLFGGNPEQLGKEGCHRGGGHGRGTAAKRHVPG